MTKIVWSIALAATATLVLVGGVLPASADPGSVFAGFIETEDLFAQQSMADSAKAMTLIAWIQIAIGVVTLGGLFWTVKYTRNTALSGQASASVAEKMLNNVERPYIFLFGVHGISAEDYMGEPNFFIKYSIANHGKTPAILEYFSAEVSFGISPGEPKEVVIGHPAKHTPIMPPAEVREEQIWCPENMEFMQISGEDDFEYLPIPKPKDGQDFFFQILVRYRGPFTKDHETGACWHWDEDALCLVQYGGAAYNYTR